MPIHHNWAIFSDVEQIADFCAIFWQIFVPYFGGFLCHILTDFFVVSDDAAGARAEPRQQPDHQPH